MIDLEMPVMLQNDLTPIVSSHVVPKNADQNATGVQTQFKASVIDLFHAIHQAQAQLDWAEPIVRCVKISERLASQIKLKGCVYVLSLLSSALVKNTAVLDGQTHASLLSWADKLSSLSCGEMPSEDAPSILTSLSEISWFAAIPEAFKELIGSRLCDDARAQNEARANLLMPLAAPVTDASNVTPRLADISVAARSDVTAELPTEPLTDRPAEPAINQVDATTSDLPALRAFPVIDTALSTAAADEYVLLAEAFEQADESLAGDLLTLPELSDSESTAAWLSVFETARDQFAVARNAAEYMGVQSLDVALGWWEANLTAIMDQPAKLDESHRSVLLLASSSWHEYFKQPSRATALAAIAALEEKCWIQPLNNDQVNELANALSKVSLVASRQVEPRSESFDVEDLSLDIPADADWSVVQILLRELPELSSQFTHHIGRVNRGDLGAIDAAQRVAHSLKGSGNTVGIRGVANLTHQLEDMLIIIARDSVAVIGPLAQFLSEAADCLEEMSEAVAGVGEAPDSAVDVYARAIHWTNRLVSGDLDLAMPAMLAQAPLAPVATATQDSLQVNASLEGAPESETESYVRVPVSLIDRLLAMVGESSVLLAKAQNEVQAIGLTQRSVGDTASRLEELSADLERMVDSRGGFLRGKNRKADGFDELELDEYNEMHTMARRFAEMGSDNRVLGEQLRLNVGELTNVSGEMERMQSELRDLTLQTRMVPVQSIVSRLQRSVRQSARLTGKSVDLNIDGGETLVDNDMIAKLVDPLMHIMRNAVDHGIESAAQRQTLGKAQQGHIQVSFIRERGTLLVRCQDDGGGLDVARVRQKAIDRGLIQPSDSLSESAIVELILQPGFSTRDATNQMSGRGIGLDVVAQLVRDLKGELEIQHVAGVGTTFLLTLPLNLSSIPVMVAKTSDYGLAIALRGIEQIVAARDVEETPKGSVLTWNDQQVEALWLEDLVGIPRARGDLPDRVGLLVRSRNAELVVVLTPELSQARNVLVKPLSEYVAKMRGIDGAAALGDGSAAPICDLPELLANYRNRGRVVAAAARKSDAPRCLVVDDSVSVRRAMEAFVKDLGFEVDSARDGMEALAMIEKRLPALMIVDFEMPRMNGVELTRNVRQNAALLHVPIIMITSRSADKHRTLALEAGVNHYMTKPYTEDDLSEQIFRLHGVNTRT